MGWREKLENNLDVIEGKNFGRLVFLNEDGTNLPIKDLLLMKVSRSLLGTHIPI